MENISSSELGAHVHWERNMAKSKRDGLQPCRHCGKGMLEDTGYVGIWSPDYFHPLAEVDEALSEGAEFVRIGNECVKNFADKTELPLYFVKMSECRFDI